MGGNNMKKKVLAIIFSTVLAAAMVTGCAAPKEETPAEPKDGAEASATEPAKADGDLTVIKVGACPTPHGEILTEAKALLAAEGIDLQLVEFTDYVQPNLALSDKQLDANYFQHQPYLTDFNEKNSTKLVSIGTVHYEPMGIYPGKTTDIASIADGAKVAVPNDLTNEARALLLLEANGLIKVNPDAGLSATKADITENPKNLEIIEVEAAQLPRSIADVDISVINGNYAIQADLDVSADALAKEENTSLAAETYANILVVREGDETRPELVKLKEVLQSDAIKTYIADNYKGAVESIVK